MADGKKRVPLNAAKHGGIAQLGERLLCKQEVNGSIPFISTSRLSLRRIPKWEQAKRPSGCFDRLTAQREDERDSVLTSSRKGEQGEG